MTRAWLFNHKDQPMKDEIWVGSRCIGTKDAEASLDRTVEEGEIISLHMGHGNFRPFTVIASDNGEAILQHIRP